jgi:hypothetical protein
LLLSRFSYFPLFLAAVATGSVIVVACGSADLGSDDDANDAGGLVRDGALVEPKEGGAAPDASAGPPPSCDRYCDLVTENCSGANAQYASKEDCFAFCNHLPLTEPSRELGEKSPSVECRQYWADTPARTNPKDFCLSAGPFGGGVCGYRCTAFCDVALSACPPDGGSPPYETSASCASACTTYSYRDGGDGSGEGPTGPTTGDTLNCRQYWLRQATKNPAKCAALKPQSDFCR